MGVAASDTFSDFDVAAHDKVGVVSGLAFAENRCVRLNGQPFEAFIRVDV